MGGLDMQSKSSLHKDVKLAARDWIGIALLFALVVSIAYWLPWLVNHIAGAINLTFGAAEFVAIIVGALALAAAAYAARSANRLTEFELSRGYRAAMSIIQVDTEEALRESVRLLDKLRTLNGNQVDDWNEAVEELCRFEQRYVRRQDQLPFLSTHFPPAGVREVQSLYLAIEMIFWRSTSLSLESRLGVGDKSALINRRQETVSQNISRYQQDALRHYQKLELEELPKSITDRITTGTIGSGASKELPA
jgi:hypothetical protein